MGVSKKLVGTPRQPGGPGGRSVDCQRQPLGGDAGVGANQLIGVRRMKGQEMRHRIKQHPSPATRHIKALRLVEKDTIAFEGGSDAAGVFGEGNDVIRLGTEFVGLGGGQVALELEDLEGC